MYLLLGFIAYIIPSKVINKHIQKSVPQLTEQKCYPQAFILKKPFQMDNYTDALILNQVYYLNTENPLNSILLLPRYDEDPVDQTKSLQKACEQKHESNRTYGRYWHGSTFITKLLLLFGSYDTVRYLLYIITSLLFITCCFFLSKRTNIFFGLCFFVTYVLSNFFITQFSIQFAPTQILCFILTLLILKEKFNYKNSLAFFVIGSLVAYFDLLTTPLITLGIPLCIYILLFATNLETAFDKIKKITCICIQWCAGYLFTWATKWGLATLLTNENIFINAGNKIAERTQTDDSFSRWNAITGNLDLLPIAYILLFVAIFLCIAILFYKKNSILTSLFLLGIALFPYAWFFATANHSYMHYWFTYRTQMIFIFAVFCAITNCIDFDKFKEWFKNIKS